jgi:hypothetical protein
MPASTEENGKLKKADGFLDQAGTWGSGLLDVGKGVIDEIRYATGHKRPAPEVAVPQPQVVSARPAPVPVASRPAPAATTINLQPASSGSSTTMMTPGAYPPVSYNEYKGVNTSPEYKEAESTYNKDKMAEESLKAEIFTENAPKIMEENKRLIGEIKQNFDQMTEDAKFQKRSLGDAFSDASAGRKVMAAIGIAFGALGSGLTGKENAAIAAIEKNLDDEYKSRKDRLNNMMAIADKRQNGIYKQAQMRKIVADNFTALQFGELEAQALATISSMGDKTGNTRVQQLLEMAMQSRVSKRVMDSLDKYTEQHVQRIYDAEMSSRLLDPKIINKTDEIKKNPDMVVKKPEQKAPVKAANKPVTGEANKIITMSTDALKGVDMMEKALREGQNTFSLVGDNDFTLGSKLYEESIGRLNSGAMINASETAKYKSMRPQITDTKEMQAKKLAWIRESFQQRIQLATKGVSQAASPAPHGQRVRQNGKVYEWNGSEYIEVQ